MRLLDYQHYDVEVFDGYVFFEAPLREKPSGNRLERAYQRMVRPLPGLRPEDRRVWRYIYIYPNTTVDLYPDQVTTWQINPAGIDRTHDVYACYRAPDPTPVMRAVQRLNQRLNIDVADEDRDLVARVQAGMATRGWQPGPLGEREAAVAWFANRVRRDLERAG
jgi:Rieske 2Fe-2S family protein